MKYRDTKTGKFVSASTWRRSRAHGGTRYKRVNRSRPKKSGVSPVAPPQLPRGYTTYETVSGPIPTEFLAADDDFFESGYESDEEDEYA